MTTPTDWRELCAELLEALEIQLDELASTNRLCKRARTALAKPVPQGPTDEELLELMPETMRDEFGYAAKVCSDATGGQVKPGIFRVCLNHTALEYARAVLARWGRPAIKPVPVSERLPGEGDCDPSFQCWWFTPSEEKWILWPIKWAGPECSYWLPHHALPVPVSEQDA